ncbi:MAG: Short-chain-enoyl-CoA hydratase [Myxococcota bacterium]|nr:Short-chain-enoyl-CoA hydratase [Myxococcota bacterium]
MDVTLGREPCNEIGADMLTALEGLVRAADDLRPRVMILRSTAARGFCAGADLRELHRGLQNVSRLRAAPRLASFIWRIHRVMDWLDMAPFPTIAVIHGVCFGGGLELALTCDLRIAEKQARFAFPELRLGIVPGFGGIPRLERDCGASIARDLLLTGRSISAARAVETGLAHQLVPAGEGLNAALSTAEQLMKYNPWASAQAKAFAKKLPALRLAEEKALFLLMASRPGMREALEHFVNNSSAMPYLG